MDSANRLLKTIINHLPASRAQTVRLVHEDLLRAADRRAKNSIRLGFTHALAKRDSDVAGTEQCWWARQLHRWEILWRNVSQASSDFTNFRRMCTLKDMSDGAFKIYDQLIRESVSTITPTPNLHVEEEARRWREAATHILHIHHNFLLMAVDCPDTVKNPQNYGITRVKERVPDHNRALKASC